MRYTVGLGLVGAAMGWVLANLRLVLINVGIFLFAGIILSTFWNEGANSAQMKQAVKFGLLYGPDDAVAGDRPGTIRMIMHNYSRYDAEDVTIDCDGETVNNVGMLAGGKTKRVAFHLEEMPKKCVVNFDRASDNQQLRDGITVKSSGVMQH